MRYRELIARATSASMIADQDVGTILTVMSSGERVWYRFGALACWTLERTRGRSALIAAITDPSVFSETTSELLKAR
jgi:hypothetical protein